jgi:hypothetical protein
VVTLAASLASAAETLDATQKVGGAYFTNQGGSITVITGLNTTRTQFMAACSPDNATWFNGKAPLPNNYSAHPFGGAYPVPDVVIAQPKNKVGTGVFGWAFPAVP